jgi:hypothetical protein
VLIFDGQHKIAGLLWNGRREFECKIYLNPNAKLLGNTNVAAHDKFSQTRFYASVMVKKLGAEFGDDFERFPYRAKAGCATSTGSRRTRLAPPVMVPAVSWS